MDNEGIIDVEFEENSKKINGTSKIRYTATQVADILDLPVSRIRYYATVFSDILDIETSNGNRKYTESTIKKLQYIVKLKDEDGMTVQQIRDYCEKYEFFNEEGLIPQDKPLAIDMFTEAIKIEMANQLEVFRDEIKKDIRNEMKDLLMAQYQANDELKQSICVSIDELVDEKLTNQMNEIVKLQKEELRSTTEALNEVNMQLKELKETAYVSMEEVKKISYKDSKDGKLSKFWNWFNK